MFDSGRLRYHSVMLLDAVPRPAARTAPSGKSRILSVKRNRRRRYTAARAALQLMRPLPWALVVLHEVRGGPLARLDRFIATMRAAGRRFCQGFSAARVALCARRKVRPMHGYASNQEVPILQV